MRKLNDWIKDNLQDCKDEIEVHLGITAKDYEHAVCLISSNILLYNWACSQIDGADVACESHTETDKIFLEIIETRRIMGLLPAAVKDEYNLKLQKLREEYKNLILGMLDGDE